MLKFIMMLVEILFLRQIELLRMLNKTRREGLSLRGWRSGEESSMNLLKPLLKANGTENLILVNKPRKALRREPFSRIMHFVSVGRTSKEGKSLHGFSKKR